MKKSSLNICCVLALAALAQSAQAQFTYTGGTLTTAQTYDGTGVDAGLNPDTIGTGAANAANDDYINGGSGSGSLTVQSGSLTINDDDFKVGNNTGAGNAGLITVNSGATLNINNIGRWGAGVGQGASSLGTLTTAGTVNWLINGSNEQRFRIGNGGTSLATAAHGTVNVNGGTFTVSKGANTGDNHAGLTVGSDGGIGTLNLNAGLFLDLMALPLTVGCSYDALSGTTLTASVAGSAINISNGTLEMDDAYAPFNASKATFVVGAGTGVVNFQTGTGSLSLLGWASSDYLALATAGELEVNGSVVSDLSQFNYSLNGGQGVLQLAAVPEPSSFAMIGSGLMALGYVIRRRK